MSSDLNKFLDVLFDGMEGYVYSPTLMRESQDFQQHFFQYPKDRNSLISHIETKGSIQDVYISPVMWKFPGKIAKNTFQSSRVAYTEVDGNYFDESIYEPTLRVQSSTPGNEHVYFVLDKPTNDPNELEKINRVITYATEGDASAWDFSQVLRPPGTRNFKYENLPEVKVVEVNNNTLSRSLFKGLPEQKPLIDKLGTIPELMSVIAKYTWNHDDFEFFQKPTQENGSRSSAMMRLGHICIELGMTPEDSYAILYDADERWGKYKGRQDREARLLEIVNKASVTVSPKVASYNLMTSDQLYDADYTDIEWVVQNVLLPGSVGVVYSAPGIGKTRLSMSMAVALATGKNFLGYEIKRKHKVLFFSLEMGDYELQLFYKTMVTQQEAQEIGPWLTFYAEGSRLDIDKATGQEVVYNLVRQIKPDVIMIDSIGAAVSADVSRNEEVSEFFKFLSKVRRETGVAIWLIHHGRKATSDNKSPKSLADMYGSMYIGAEATTVFCLVATTDVNGGGSDPILHTVKARFVLDKTPTPLVSNGGRLERKGDSSVSASDGRELLNAPFLSTGESVDGNSD